MSLNSKYTIEQIKAMNLVGFFREATYDDILHSVRVLKVARYARESTNHEDQRRALENQIDRLDILIRDNPNYTIEWLRSKSREPV